MNRNTNNQQVSDDFDPDSYVAEQRALNSVKDKLYALIKELNNSSN